MLVAAEALPAELLREPSSIEDSQHLQRWWVTQYTYMNIAMTPAWVGKRIFLKLECEEEECGKCKGTEEAKHDHAG